jgi:hypothetical protein
MIAMDAINLKQIDNSKRLVIRIFTDYKVSNLESVLGSQLSKVAPGIDLFINKSGRADLVLVLNTTRHFRWVLAPESRIYKILQEPTVKSPLTHLFTYRHPRYFKRVYTHTPSPEKSKEIRSHGFLGSDVALDVQEIGILPNKTELVSVIASTLGILSGHKRRVEFVDSLISEFPQLCDHLYGRGRKNELKRKIEGLWDYRFSVAIENTAQPSYISEKFTDCIRAGVVPLYFGAQDIAKYFPKDCFIELPIHDEKKCFEIISNLSVNDYEKRKDALLQAQRIVASSFTLTSFINDCAEEMRMETEVTGSRFRLLFGLNGVLLRTSQAVGFASRFIPNFIKRPFARLVYPNL